MCGICGFLKFNGRVSGEDRVIVEKMNSTLRHRGPDAQEVLLRDNVALGFSRLSIIGLANGMQPIGNEDGTLWLVCNGEIFNYVELREGLRSRGHRFSTQSDVEVILHLYEERGTEFLNLLNGQFAFALYDANRRRLFCARDQLGIVPFHYTLAEGQFIFGSEIKCILQHPLANRRVDLVGLDQILTFAGLISPRTVFKDIRSLQNGHYLLVGSDGAVRDVEYWDVEYPEGEVMMNGKPESFYLDRLEEIFEKSVKLRLQADVPLGIYVSGGLDSSMIAMKVNQLDPFARKEAFSIDFSESTLSETRYQVLVAEQSNANLNRKTFLYSDISERLRQVIYHCECPLKETYNTASISLSESTRQKGIRVILSGEGSDEFFAGYVGYRFDKMRAGGLGRQAVTPEEEQLRLKVWGDKSTFYETDFVANRLVKRQLYSAEVNAAFEEVDCLNHFIVNHDRLRNRSMINQRSYLDYKIRLVDHLVSDHGDRMALANSVEVRYPFLDKDLVEFSTSVPGSLKLSEDFVEKYVLKRMARRFVPKQIIEREKFGFVAPGSPYLLQNDVEYINDLLSYDTIRRQGYFDPDCVEQLKSRYKQPGFALNVPFESDLLITVITFGILLDSFFS